MDGVFVCGGCIQHGSTEQEPVCCSGLTSQFIIVHNWSLPSDKGGHLHTVGQASTDIFKIKELVFGHLTSGCYKMDAKKRGVKSHLLFFFLVIGR